MNPRPAIDWNILAESLSHYRERGYVYTETPWIIALDTVRLTFPDTCVTTSDGRALVGSAEQGFLALDLAPGRYVSCSPCFRQDDDDEYHHPDFMKVELFVTDPLVTLADVIEDALSFHSRYGKVDLVETDEGWDITSNGIELGSYGLRSARNITWIYGTGVALPRLSQVLRGG